ncbi:MAG: ATP-dependent zinc metalloprotease FtsH [Actinomycetota bacterium]|nr:ATP-dependent zinc metalloprotease FtsH [Actinomycetota bacterium]
MMDKARERMRRTPLPSRGTGGSKPVPPRGEGPAEQQRWVTVAWIVGGVIALTLFQSFFGPRTEEISFTRFFDLAEKGSIVEANISESSVTGRLKEPGDEETSFTTTIPPNFETNEIYKRLERKGVDVSGSQPSPWTAFFFAWVVPFGLIAGLYFLFMRRLRRQMGGAGGPLSLGKNKAKLYDRTDMKTTFDDVAGVDEVETELVELVDYLKRPDKYQKIGARIPKGVLLVGPPGTGKTLLARAVAGEAGVPFFYISASEFIEMFVGLGAARVRDLFEQARGRAPAIIFIDEIDAIGQSRSGAAGYQMGAHQEQEQTLQQLLTEMDGFEPNSGVIIVAASNRPEVLDQALLRPGRFDRQIQVNLPDIGGRREILEIHAKKVRLAPDADLRVLARRTPGFSGAQLANVINEGALLAARRGRDVVDMRDLEEAVDRVVAGLERRSQVLTDNERQLVAYHELGHAVVARFVEHADPVHRVSIIPRGIGALGYTQQLPDEERYLMSEPELRDRIAVLLGGRSAEELVFGYATTGAQDDLKKATEIARRMVMEFGMSEKIGPLSLGGDGSRFLNPAFRRTEDVSDETEVAIDREVKAILFEARDRARAILADRRHDLDVLAEVLLEKESLDRRDLDSHFSPRSQEPPADVSEPAVSESAVSESAATVELDAPRHPLS